MSIGGVDATMTSSVVLGRSAGAPVEDVVTVPALAPGSYQVVVTNPDGQSATAPGAFAVGP